MKRFICVGAQKAGTTSLYDMLNQHPDVVKKMRAAYDQFWKEARPLMVNEDAPMSPTRPFHVWFDEQMKNGGIPDWKPPTL